LSIFLTVVSLIIFVSTGPVFAETLAEQRARLEIELANIEADIGAKRGVLQEKQKERTTLERDVAILNAKIDKAKLSIKYRDITLGKLRGEISGKANAIEELNQKVDRSHASLAQILRNTNQSDDMTFVELALGGSMSDLFEDIDNFAAIERELGVTFESIAALKEDLSERKNILEERQLEEEDLRRIQVLEKQSVERNQKSKQEVLEVTQGEEKVYQKLIAEREKSAAEIRAALFSLRDSAAIPFGDAYRFAKEASAITDVRPAVILGIIAEESNLGENVGQCLLKDPATGDGVGKNTGRFFKGVMKPSRDVEPFLEIARQLGFDPYNMPVSCPPSYGYGGAMGPAQFIPSTWVLYKDRVAKITGTSPASPWDARTAFFASALLMSDNGADKGTREAERLAALRYFAGWKNAQKSTYAFYGDEVMELADKFQHQIDILER